jgi:hypothetical protein
MVALEMYGLKKSFDFKKYATQQRVKLIAIFSLLTKVLADFLSVNYLLTLVLKGRY